VFESKLKNKFALKKLIAGPRANGKKIVFTNGCFDILHYGHAKYLEETKAKADILIVAVNSDVSVQKLKGQNRPLISQKFRAKMVAALESVDYVVIFPEATPLKIIEFLKPDVLIKGGDWAESNIVGGEFVKSYGGKVSSVRFIQGFSTTGIIKKIVKTF